MITKAQTLLDGLLDAMFSSLKKGMNIVILAVILAFALGTMFASLLWNAVG